MSNIGKHFTRLDVERKQRELERSRNIFGKPSLRAQGSLDIARQRLIREICFD
jgi:hypothetical protein